MDPVSSSGGALFLVYDLASTNKNEVFFRDMPHLPFATHPNSALPITISSNIMSERIDYSKLQKYFQKSSSAGSCEFTTIFHFFTSPYWKDASSKRRGN
jgi:hypothetical protein